MKKIITCSVATLALTGLSSAALAAIPGTYLGAGLGYGQLEGANFVSMNNVNVVSEHSRGFVAGRVFVGYNFTQYVGIEGGYSYLGREKYTFKNTHVPNSSVSFTSQLQDADLVAKTYLPISNTGFNVYALGGAAFVNSRLSAFNVNLHDNNTTLGSSSSSNAVRPKYGVGLNYDIPNSPISTNLELSRVQGQGSESNIPNADSAMFTVSYNFG